MRWVLVHWLSRSMTQDLGVAVVKVLSPPKRLKVTFWPRYSSWLLYRPPWKSVVEWLSSVITWSHRSCWKSTKYIINYLSGFVDLIASPDFSDSCPMRQDPHCSIHLRQHDASSKSESPSSGIDWIYRKDCSTGWRQFDFSTTFCGDRRSVESARRNIYVCCRGPKYVHPLFHLIWLFSHSTWRTPHSRHTFAYYNSSSPSLWDDLDPHPHPERHTNSLLCHKFSRRFQGSYSEA